LFKLIFAVEMIHDNNYKLQLQLFTSVNLSTFEFPSISITTLLCYWICDTMQRYKLQPVTEIYGTSFTKHNKIAI